MNSEKKENIVFDNTYTQLKESANIHADLINNSKNENNGYHNNSKDVLKDIDKELSYAITTGIINTITDPNLIDNNKGLDTKYVKGLTVGIPIGMLVGITLGITLK